MLIIPLTGTFSKNIWGFQLEDGAIATDFEKQPYDTEVNICKRYYQEIAGMFYSGYNGAGAGIAQTISLPVPMRAVPTVTKSGTTSYANASNWAIVDGTTNSSTTSFLVGCVVTTTGNCSVNGAAQIYKLSAELI